LPNANLYGESVLQPNEIITHVVLPAPGQRSASYEVRFKQSHDWPLAAAAVNLVMSGTTVKSARIVLGAVAPIPWRVQAAEKMLAGKTITEAVAVEIANAALAGAKPMSGNKYKIQIAKTAVKRALLAAARNA
jgi:xanthine dehydrogenase YagS FAD-binding subunit